MDGMTKNGFDHHKFGANVSILMLMPLKFGANASNLMLMLKKKSVVEAITIFFFFLNHVL
jgi:hypothetical protein